MIRIFLYIVVAVILACPVSAKEQVNATLDLGEWAREQAAALPESIDGVKIFRPIVDDGKAVVSDLIDLPATSAECLFTAALAFIADNIEPETDVIDAIDYESYRFALTRMQTQGTGKNTASYKYTLAVQAADDIMSFSEFDIKVEYKEKGILPRTIGLEKCKPAENTRHRELVEGFSFVSSKFLKDMCDFISANKDLKVTHWNEIKSNQVVKGMNEVEVKLAAGRPANVRSTGNRTKWMYSNDFVVIFTEGIVSTVIE